jgi:hypothetical protein
VAALGHYLGSDPLDINPRQLDDHAMTPEGADDDSDDPVTGQVQELNRDFYRLEPTTYFLFRLRNLVLSAGRGLELEQLLIKGVEVGVFKLSAPDGSRLDSLDEEQEEERHAFVTLETEVLLHHLSETLLRLYLAHEHSPPCPWISLSRERSPRRFKKKAAALLDRLETVEGQELLTRAFFGTTDRSTIGGEAVSEEMWTELVDSCRLWLSWFARYILDGDVYNAAKHGLGVHPQRIALTVEIDGEAFIGGSGPCLEFLQSVRDADGHRRWRRTTKWVQWDRLFGAVHIACQLIDRLWTVARARYAGSGEIDLELRVFASPSELFESEEMSLAKISHSLGFDADSLP